MTPETTTAHRQNDQMTSIVTLADLPPPPPKRHGWPWTLEAAPAAIEPDAPTITLVTPSFNQRAFIEAALRSVLLQGYPGLEYIVIDGGSTDGSVEVIRKYERWLARYVSEKDRGQSDALNKGFANASGRILGWLNCDDRLLPGALHALARAVRATPKAVAWAAKCRSVTPSGRLIFLQEPRGLTRGELADWGYAGRISQPACFFSREAFQRVGGVEEGYHYAMDYHLWLKLAREGPFVKCDDTWAEETIHAEAKSYAQRGRSLAEVHLIQLREGYQELALSRMGEELQILELLKRALPLERLRYQISLIVRSILRRWR
jgi:GT2 family glycosyltransferase